MKKVILVLMAVMFVAVAGHAFANEGVEVEAGIKMWYPGWKNEDPAGSNTKFDPTLLIGPAVEVKLPNHLFFEASYLLSTADFEKTEGTTKITADRKDLDVSIGYDFIPQAGIFVGYKSVSIDAKFTDPAGSGSASIDLSGPVIGLRGNAPINEMFGIYANASYLMTKVENKSSGNPTVKEDAPGTVFELGAKAHFSKALSGTLGYKVESTKEDKSNIKDTFSGVTLGVMYAF